MKKKALIVGITGQDGSYLAHHLLQLGYIVHGTSRDILSANSYRLDVLNIKEKVQLHSMNITDFRSILSILAQINPVEIYNLSGQTSVSLSFKQPVEAIESISIGTLNLLEAVRFFDKSIKVFNASSSEIFGNCHFNNPANESTPFAPRSPYGVAKASLVWQVATYRNSYGINACTGILANHESPLRPQAFVLSKIINDLKLIKKGQKSHIELGDLSIIRDWGWAPEYIKAIHLCLQKDKFRDYIIASGSSCSLNTFLEVILEQLKLDTSVVKFSSAEMRPSELTASYLDPSLIYQDIGWKASSGVKEIANKLIKGELF